MSNITSTTLDKLEDSLDTRFRDVFISYGRAESKAFATKLCEQLTDKGYKVWFDQNDIPLGVDFQHQIDEGIEMAHNFIFVIAPHAVKSPYCRKEIDLAIKRGKRIIPILHIEPTEKEVWDRMHPVIGKINWVYMRQKWEKEQEQTDYETIDDFETGFNGVLSLLEQEKEYVQKHTQILFRAIEWERNHHNSMHLLVANERKQAEEWLFQRFDSTQPPCLPSDLHARFISEAKKNANNLQTDVFIASAEKESTESVLTRDQIIYRLSLYGYTSWTHVNDLNSGVDFHDAIKKGVEGADNLVFLITKESLASEYCIEELEYAIYLNKRIIPIRLEEINENEFPVILKNIQYIDFTDNTSNTAVSKNDKTDFDKDIDDILKILATDSEYLQRHKTLLTQALKWEHQDKNPSMLLRGYNLEQAKVWLKIGQKRDKNLPLSIHENFIKESQAKSSSERTDVFISYSRTDGDVARKLNEDLQIAGKTTWFDQESIASGADFQKEIYDGIQNADNIVFILSPESILSPYCADEVEFAQKLGKRFITLLYREINTEELHGALSTVQWIDFRPNHTKVEKQFAEVMRTLDTDREHVQAHTKWQNEAMEWANFDKNNDFLLRGNELLLANEWIEDAKENQKKPKVTDLQKEFTTESLNQEKKVTLAIERNKQIFIATIAIILAVAILAGSQWYKSYQHQRESAIKNLIFEAKDMIDFAPERALELSYGAYKASDKIPLIAIRNLYHIIENSNITQTKKTLFFELKARDSILSIVAAKDKSFFVVIERKGLSLFDNKGHFVKKLDKEKPNSYQNKITSLSKINHIHDTSQNRGGKIYQKIQKPHFAAISENYIITHSDDRNLNLFDKEGNKIRVITQTEIESDTKIGFIDIEGKHSILVMNGMLGASHPNNFAVFDTLGTLLSEYKEVSWEGELYKEVAKKWQNVDFKLKYKSSLLNKKISYSLSEKYTIEQNDDNKWTLNHIFKDSVVSTDYLFPTEVHFSLLDSNYLVVYNHKTAYIFLSPNYIEPILSKYSLSPEDKIHYDIASLDDYRKVPRETASVIAKALLFLTVFLLSILVLNYMNMLYLSQRYFKIIIYVIVGFFIGMAWVTFIMNEKYVIQIAFSSALYISIFGGFWGVKNIRDKLYFNGILYLFVSLLLLFGSGVVYHYLTREKGGIEGTIELFGIINLLILAVIIIVGFATEKASFQLSQRNFTYFSDWLGVVSFVVILFLMIAITKTFNVVENQEYFMIGALLPFTYFIRTLVHHWVLYHYQKTPYSLTVLRGYIPTLIIIFFLIVGLIIEWGGQNRGANNILRVSIIAGIIYSTFLYIYTIFVAYKQKDKLNLRANFFFWWTILLLIFVVVPSVSFEKFNFIFIITVIIWLIPLIFRACKFFKSQNIKKQETVVTE